MATVTASRGTFPRTGYEASHQTGSTTGSSGDRVIGMLVAHKLGVITGAESRVHINETGSKAGTIHPPPVHLPVPDGQTLEEIWEGNQMSTGPRVAAASGPYMVVGGCRTTTTMDLSL